MINNDLINETLSAIRY